MTKLDLSILDERCYEFSDDDYSDIDGKFVKKLRNALCMTQIVFANYLGVTKKTIEKWEQGKNKIKGPALRIIRLIDKNPAILSELCTIMYKKEQIYVQKYSFTEFEQVTTDLAKDMKYEGYDDILSAYEKEKSYWGKKRFSLIKNTEAING